MFITDVAHSKLQKIKEKVKQSINIIGECPRLLPSVRPDLHYPIIFCQPQKLQQVCGSHQLTIHSHSVETRSPQPITTNYNKQKYLQ